MCCTWPVLFFQRSAEEISTSQELIELFAVLLKFENNDAKEIYGQTFAIATNPVLLSDHDERPWDKAGL